MRPIPAALATLTLALALLAACPARAQDVPPEARDLAQLVFTPGSFDATMSQAGKMGSQVVRANLEGRLQRQLSPGEAAQLQALFTRLMKEAAPKPEWETLYATLIARHFSRDEMRDLAAFYRTPLGAKAIRLSGILVTEGAAAGEGLMKSREREFGERFGAKFSREFPALARELECQQPR